MTLELSNVANLPIMLWPGMKIGQLCLFRLSSPAEHPYGSSVYGSRYQGQRGPTASRSWQNWRTWATSTDEPMTLIATVGTAAPDPESPGYGGPTYQCVGESSYAALVTGRP